MDAHRINKIIPNHPALLFDIPFKYEIGTAIDVTDPAVREDFNHFAADAQIQENLGIKDAKKKELDKLDKETGGEHREEILQYALNAGFGEAALTAAKEWGIQINRQQLIKLENIAQREVILQKDVVLQGNNLEVDAETVYNHKLRVKLERLPRVSLSEVGTALYQTCREYICHNSVTPKFEIAGKKFGVFIEGVPSPRGGTSDILVSVPGDTKKGQKVPIDNNLIDLDKHEVIGITDAGDVDLIYLKRWNPAYPNEPSLGELYNAATGNKLRYVRIVVFRGFDLTTFQVIPANPDGTISMGIPAAEILHEKTGVKTTKYSGFSFIN